MKRTPQRQCLACRVRDEQSKLMRFTFQRGESGGHLEIDQESKPRRSGRGVYLHPRFECVRVLREVGRLARSLRVDAKSFVKSDLEELFGRLSFEVIAS